MEKKIKNGKITVEIRVVDIKKLLNILWMKDIKVTKVKQKNISTVNMVINYLDYEEVKEVVGKLDGNIACIKGTGTVFFVGKIKKKYSLVIATFIFLGLLYYLSTFIWAIDIETGNNISPFQVRKELREIGIYPGMKKAEIEVKEIEKELATINSEILWLRVRVEGSTLKVHIDEKINPPKEAEGGYGNLVATQDCEIKRVYTFAGRSAVVTNQIVKAGDVVIEGIDGNEGAEYVVPPRGIVIANTFYEKEIEVQTTGTTLVRSGKKDSDIYLSVFGKRIYLKKAIKGFENYDKIEKSSKLFNEVLYYERVGKEIDISEDEAVNNSIFQLEKSLLNDLSREAKVVDRIVTKERKDDGKLIVKVVFVVEQNIVSDVVVGY